MHEPYTIIYFLSAWFCYLRTIPLVRLTAYTLIFLVAYYFSLFIICLGYCRTWVLHCGNEQTCSTNHTKLFRGVRSEFPSVLDCKTWLHNIIWRIVYSLGKIVLPQSNYLDGLLGTSISGELFFRDYRPQLPYPVGAARGPVSTRIDSSKQLKSTNYLLASVENLTVAIDALHCL
jgi:hypothetical protein